MSQAGDHSEAGGDGRGSIDTSWDQLQKKQKAEMEAVRREREQLEEEKRIMSTLAPDSSDIVSINAGGQVVIQAHRATLTIATGSTFSAMFNGRWEESCARDEHDRVFLDHDPELIQWIVNYLRIKKIEDPSNPLGPPSVPKEKKEAFMCLLNYFGLQDFFYPLKTYFPEDMQVIQPQGSSVSTELSCRRLWARYEGFGHWFMAVTPALSPPGPHFWKCTICSLANNGWIYLGVTSNLSSSDESYRDSTSYGWAASSQRYIAGRRSNDSGWSTFQQGEVLYFQLKDRSLSMFSKQKIRLFCIENVPQHPYLHFNFHPSGTEIELEPMSHSEISEIDW